MGDGPTTGTQGDRPERPEDHRVRYLLAGLAGAVVALLLGFVVWNALDGDTSPSAPATPDPTAAIEDPAGASPSPGAAPSPSPVATGTGPTPGPTPTPTDTVAAGEPEPGWFVAVTRDGRLVVVDTATGDELRELDAMGDPTQERDEPEADIKAIGEVELTPDRRTVYYSDCCEPAVGSIYRIPVDGGERTRVGDGHDPAVSPDGTRLAALQLGGIVVLDLGSGASFVIEDPDSDGVVGHPTWSPDGSRIAWDRGRGGPDDAGEVVVADAVEGATPRTLVAGGARPAWRADDLIVVDFPAGGGDGGSQLALMDADTGEVVEPFWALDGRVVGQDLDPVGVWLVTVLESGEALAVSDGDKRTVGSGFVDAAW